MKTVKIGDKKPKEMLQQEVLDIAMIESVHLSFEHDGEKIWDYPKIIDFTNTIFSDTTVIDYQQTRISDGLEGKIIVFFLNHEDFSFHWHFKGEEHQSRESKRLKIESLKYLINKGYCVPLY